MAEAADGVPRREAGCGIGVRLREAREREGLTIAQAAQRLHVSGEALEALEAERFDAFGAPIYVKSYLSRYAELLGESPQALLARLASAAEMPQPDLTRVPHVAVRGDRHATMIFIAIGVLIVGAVAGWTWSHRHAVQAMAVSVPLTEGHTSVARTSHAPAGAPRSAAPRTAVAAAPVSAPAPAPAQGATRITLYFPAVSWMSVSDAAGHHLFRGTASAGATKTFTGPAPLHVVLGYGNGVTLRVNGHAAPIGPYVGRDHAVSIAVGADGRVAPAPRHAGG